MVDKIPTMKTLREAAAETGLSYDCLRKKCLNNEIVYITSGNKFLINMDRLVEYLNGGGRNEE